MFPDNPQSEHQHLVEISWDEFFEQFEESKLALLYEDDSLFSKIVGRDTADARAHGEHSSRHERQAEGKSGGNAGSRAAKSLGSSAAKSDNRGSQSSGRDDDDLRSREGASRAMSTIIPRNTWTSTAAAPPALLARRGSPSCMPSTPASGHGWSCSFMRARGGDLPAHVALRERWPSRSGGDRRHSQRGASRLPYPRKQHKRHLRSGARLAEKEALHLIAAFLLQASELCLRLHAFGRGHHFEASPKTKNTRERSQASAAGSTCRGYTIDRS